MEFQPIVRNATERYRRAARESGDAHGAFEAEVREYGYTTRVETKIDYVSAPPLIGELLGVGSSGARVLRRHRQMYANDVPMQWANSFIEIDIARAAGLDKIDTGPGGMLSRLAEVGRVQAHIYENIRFRPPTPEEIAFFEVLGTATLAEILHTSWTEDRRAVEVTIIVLPTTRWAFDYDWAVDDVARGE